MPVPDYYAALGLDSDASEKDIKKAYRALAKETHPDKTKNDPDREAKTEKFKEINEAYETLSDSDNKRKYDNLLAAQNEQSTEASSSQTQQTTGSTGPNPEDVDERSVVLRDPNTPTPDPASDEQSTQKEDAGADTDADKDDVQQNPDGHGASNENDGDLNFVNMGKSSYKDNIFILLIYMLLNDALKNTHSFEDFDNIANLVTYYQGDGSQMPFDLPGLTDDDVPTIADAASDTDTLAITDVSSDTDTMAITDGLALEAPDDTDQLDLDSEQLMLLDNTGSDGAKQDATEDLDQVASAASKLV